MTVRFDENGVKVDTLEEIRQQQVEQAKIKFAPYSEGKPLLTDDSSVIGRLLSINTIPVYETASILPAIVSSFRIDDSQGLQLDHLAQTIYNIKRKNSAQAVGDVILHGRVGSSVPQGSRVTNSRTGDVFTTDNVVTFNKNSVNGIDIIVNSLSDFYEVSYSIDGYLSESPNIIVQRGVADTTLDHIKARLVDAVNTQSTYLEASLTKDGLVKVNIKDQNRVGDFDATSSTADAIDIENAYAKVSVTSLTYNTQEALVGQINIKSSPISGWLSVYNPFTIEASQPIERDSMLKQRLRLFALGSTATTNAVKAEIEKVKGVSYINLRSNKNGIYITVVGGNEAEIAIAIHNSVTAGIETLGSISRSVVDLNGARHTVRFSRPKLVPIQISMSLIIEPNFPKSGIIQIKQAIVEYFNTLQVGEDVYLTRLYTPINEISGFSVKNLKFGKLTEALNTQDVLVLSHNEIATISADNIYIGGN